MGYGKLSLAGCECCSYLAAGEKELGFFFLFLQTDHFLGRKWLLYDSDMWGPMRMAWRLPTVSVFNEGIFMTCHGMNYETKYN